MRKLAPSEMPHWPRRMGAELAAAYVGVSPTKFLAGVGGKYPKPFKDDGNTLWYIEDLDDALDREKTGGAVLAANEWDR
jgi:hypothetical protein